MATRMSPIREVVAHVPSMVRRRDRTGPTATGLRNSTTFCFDKLRQEIRQSEGRLARRLDRHELVLGEILTEVKAQRAAHGLLPG
jgi:hypothetical protein